MEFEDDYDCDRILRLEFVPEVPQIVLGTNITIHADDNDAMMVEQVVDKIPVRSQVLGAKSEYFRKLFTVGMAETSQREVTIKITASEEKPFRQLIHHISGRTWELMGLTVEELLGLLALTPKYDAKDCMKFCCNELKKVMNEEIALSCLQLEPCIQMENEVQSLTQYGFEHLGKITTRELRDDTKKYFVSKYKDVERFERELIGFPLNLIVAILSSDELEVNSEDVVCKFLCKWIKAHYSQRQARIDVFRRLARYIQFRYLSLDSLKKISSSGYIEPDVVLDALFFRSELPLDYSANQEQCKGRVYRFRPVKVLRFRVPEPACAIYFELTHMVCKEMLPSGHFYTEKVELGQHALHLFATCQEQQGTESSFGLFLDLTTKYPINVDFEFAARAKPSGLFKVLHSSRGILAKGQTLGCENLVKILQKSEDSEYFCGVHFT